MFKLEDGRRRLGLGFTALFLASGVASIAAKASSPNDPEWQALVLAEAQEQEATSDAPELRFWLGIGLKKIEGDLAKHLGSQKGVFVRSVFPDSPAETAGVKTGDVLRELEGTSIDSLDTLLTLLRELEQKAEDENPPGWELKLLRGGEEKTLQITPAARPNRATDPPEVDGEKLYEEFFQERMKSWVHGGGRGAGQAFDVYRFGQPSVLWTPKDQTSWRVVLDDQNLEGEQEITVIQRNEEDEQELMVKIVREGNEPTKITVRRGDEEPQEFTEKQLDEIPEEAQRIVRQLLTPQGVVVRVPAIDQILGQQLKDDKLKFRIGFGDESPESPVRKTRGKQKTQELNATESEESSGVIEEIEIELPDLSGLKPQLEAESIYFGELAEELTREGSELGVQLKRKLQDAKSRAERALREYERLPDELTRLRRRVAELERKLKEVSSQLETSKTESP